MRKGLYKYDIGGPVSADELAAALDAIPAWRREKALSYRRDIDRFLCAKAYLLLREGLEEMFGITGDVEFAFTAVGYVICVAHDRAWKSASLLFEEPGLLSFL